MVLASVDTAKAVAVQRHAAHQRPLVATDPDSFLSCASATGEDAFGPEVISQPPLEMSLTTSSRSIWIHIPINDATGGSR
jgi:hypothetical protein